MSTIPDKAGRREWLGLAVLALPCVLYAMDLTVLDLAVPRIAVDLAPSSTELLWILDIYGFVLAGALVTMGTLGDRIGRRRLLMIGAAAFGAMSVLAACATSARMLIAARAGLGLAGATLAPSTLALLHTMFRDERQRLFAIGVWGASFSAGGLVGPLLGGALLAHHAWGSVFLIGVPVMAVLLVAGPLVLPEAKAARPGRLDVASAVLSLAAILLAIYGVKAFAHGEQGAPWLALGAAAGALFVRRQRALADPFVDLRLFANRTFSVGLALYMLAVFVVFGIYVLLAQDLQLVRGLSPLAAGVWLLPLSIGFIVGSLASPLVARRAPPLAVITGGLLLAAGALLLLVHGGDAGLVVGSLLLALGLSPVAPLATAMVVGSAPPDRAGAAAALSETGSELGGALGVALLGSLGSALYRAHAGAVGDTLADAVAAHASPAALAGAREAFAHALVVVATVGAALLLAAALALATGRTAAGRRRRAAAVRETRARARRCRGTRRTQDPPRRS